MFRTVTKPNARVVAETKMVERLFRTPEAKEASGFGSDTEFYQAIKHGRFPPPDAYVGRRTPVWFESTLKAYQARLLEVGAPAVSRTRATNAAAFKLKRNTTEATAHAAA